MIMNLETLNVALADGVVTVELNRPDKANAMSAQMWVDIGTAFRAVDETPRRAWRSSAVAAKISRPASTSACWQA
jgi:enoyl-CoA hydratase/carnithine racemase